MVLHDNLGAVNYALGSLRLHLDQYMASDRWEEVYELNGVDFVVLKNANQMKDEEWAKLCPIHLLVSCLPAKKFDPQRHQPAGREVGRRQFAEGGKRGVTSFFLRLLLMIFLDVAQNMERLFSISSTSKIALNVIIKRLLFYGLSKMSAVITSPFPGNFAVYFVSDAK